MTYGDLEIEYFENSEESGPEVDSSEEEIDMDAPLGINDPIDRLNLKTTAVRNKMKLTREKMAKIRDEMAEKRFNKDIERIDNIIK